MKEDWKLGSGICGKGRTLRNCAKPKAADYFMLCVQRRTPFSVLCTSLVFAGLEFARAQDAASPKLLEPSVTVRAAPTNRPTKQTSGPIVEIPTSAPNEKPADVAEETPPAEELATPAPATAKKTRPKRRTPAIAAPVAATMSLSAAKAAAVSTAIPHYPYEAKRAHITGSGICVITVDSASGNVTGSVMEQSTGNGILDRATTDAFQKWRFKPGTVSQIRVPISYQ
jgi:TonB family protein